MKAAMVTDNGVEVREAPKPVPKPHEILIKVRAASLNRADLAVPARNRPGPGRRPCRGDFRRGPRDPRD